MFEKVRVLEAVTEQSNEQSFQNSTQSKKKLLRNQFSKTLVVRSITP